MQTVGDYLTIMRSILHMYKQHITKGDNMSTADV
jgi:hypothetical protein